MNSKRQTEEGKQETAMVRVDHEQKETDGGEKQETAMVRVEHAQQETVGGRKTRSSNGEGRT